MLEVTIEKLVHGGQGIGTLPDGKKALLWNVLPGEIVHFEPTKNRSSYVEGVAAKIVNPSAERETPKDELYLSTSPWQMMSYEAENRYKHEILSETLQRAGVEYAGAIDFRQPKDPWQYRNKMEYSFWGDDDGLHLALYNRGTHRKQIVTGSSIARPEIDETARKIIEVLSKHKVRGGDIKTVVVRCNKAGECVAALFTKRQDFKEYKELAETCKGVSVVYSNPKSPASVYTKELYRYGDITLQDELLDVPLTYDVTSFFQGNLDAYSLALTDIKGAIKPSESVLDMYAGVGSIGLVTASSKLTLVELDQHSVEMAKRNADGRPHTEVIHSASERALEAIGQNSDSTLVVDPPRAGLHGKVIDEITETHPPKVVYLSCNPSTFARDLKLLENSYSISSIYGYNFFPRTPHIEALAILEAV